MASARPAWRCTSPASGARHPRGVWWVDLSVAEPATGPTTGHAASRIAELTALSLGLADPDPAQVPVVLGSEASLLVLDNAEHVVDEAAAFVVDLLTRAAPVSVLITSREPLGLPDEHSYPLAGMAADVAVEGAPSRDLAPAVALFLERARAVHRELPVDPDTLATVAELCRRLDGLPLALELAATRLRVFSVHDLLERVGDRLNLLSRPGRGVPRRQQTLRGMLDWSWALLDEPQRALLRRLATHRGGFDRPAAEACAGDLSTDRATVEVLTELVERSLVVTDDPPAGRPRDGVRFRLLEVVGAYAAEKLDNAGERERADERHGAYYLELAWRADAGLRGPEQRRWMRALDVERANLAHARGEAVRRGDADRALGLVLATFWYRWIGGRSRHLDAEFAEALALPGGDERLRAQATALATALALMHDPGDDPAGRVSRAVAGCAVVDDVSRARVQAFLAGIAAGITGHDDTRVRDTLLSHVREAMTVFERVGDDWSWAVSVAHWQWTVTHTGGLRPPATGRELRRILTDLGNPWALLMALAVEHREARLAGDAAAHAEVAARALELGEREELPGEVALWILETALAAIRDGEAERAEVLLARGRAAADEIAFTDAQRHADLIESVVARGQADLPRARRAMRRWTSAHGSPDVLATLEDGWLAAHEGDPVGVRAAVAEVAGTDLLTGAGAARLDELRAAQAILDGEPAQATGLLAAAARTRDALGFEPTPLERADTGVVRRRIDETPSGVG